MSKVVIDDPQNRRNSCDETELEKWVCLAWPVPVVPTKVLGSGLPQSMLTKHHEPQHHLLLCDLSLREIETNLEIKLPNPKSYTFEHEDAKG